MTAPARALPFECADDGATLRTYTPAQYALDGSPWLFGHSNPWIEVDGEPVDWTADTRPLPDVRGIEALCECVGPLPGVLVGVDEPEGIQRHDHCLFHAREDAERNLDGYGDLDAAYDLALRIPGAVVRYWSIERAE